MSHSLIVIVTRNGLALTKPCLRSAIAQQPACDVMIVDNASIDSTVAHVRTKPVALIALQKQISLAACWNMALKAAWRNKYDACFLLNCDTELRSDTINILSNYDAEIVTCVSVDTHERMGIAGDRTIEDLKKTEREHPDFSALLIRKSVSDKGLWFDEEYYPAYCEDSSFHVKCHRAGVRAVCIDLPFLHHGSSTLKQASEREAIIIRRGADKNRARFKAKYGCLPGTPGYEKLFSPETFGIDSPLRCVACGSLAHRTPYCPINKAAMSSAGAHTHGINITIVREDIVPRGPDISNVKLPDIGIGKSVYSDQAVALLQRHGVDVLG